MGDTQDVQSASAKGEFPQALYLAPGPYVRAALVVWFAELVVGVLPLAAHAVITVTVKLPQHVAEVHASAFLPEFCIVSVVISGLAVVTVFEFEPRPHPLKREITTCFMLLVAVLCLVFSGMFYAFAVAEMISSPQYAILYVWVAAVISSAAIAVRKAHGERDADLDEWRELFFEGLVDEEGKDDIPAVPQQVHS